MNEPGVVTRKITRLLLRQWQPSDSPLRTHCLSRLSTACWREAAGAS